MSMAHHLYTCRGAELLNPKEKRKCPISNFVVSDKTNQPRLWSRVCRVHGELELPVNRIIIAEFPKLSFLDYHTAYEEYKALLKVSEHILKFDIEITERMSNLACTNRIFIILDSAECKVSVCDDLMRKYPEVTLSDPPAPVAYKACHSHKHLCLRSNFSQTDEDTTSCLSGKYVHQMRSVKSKQRAIDEAVKPVHHSPAHTVLQSINQLDLRFQSSLLGISDTFEVWSQKWDALFLQILNHVEIFAATGINEAFLSDLSAFLSQGLLLFENSPNKNVRLNECNREWVYSRIRFLCYLRQYCLPICLLFDPAALAQESN